MASTPDNTPLVRVGWEDIKFDDNWEEGHSEVFPCESITEGRVLKRTDTYIVIGSSYDYQNDVWGTIHAFSLVPPTITTLIEP